MDVVHIEQDLVETATQLFKVVLLIYTPALQKYVGVSHYGLNFLFPDD